MRGRWTLKKKMIIVFFIIVVCPVVILSAITSKVSRTSLETAVYLSTKQNLRQGLNAVDTFVDLMISASNALYLNEDVKSIVRGSDMIESRYGNAYTLRDYTTLQSVITAVETSILLRYTASFTLMDSQERIYRNREGNHEDMYQLLQASAWYNQALEANGFLVFTAPYRDEWTGIQSIAVSRLLREYQKGNWAILHISVDEREVHSSLFGEDTQQDHSYWMLLNDANVIISHPDESMVGQLCPEEFIREGDEDSFVAVINSNRVFVSLSDVSRTDWKIIQVTDYDELFYDVSYNSWITMLFALGLLCAFLIVSLLLIDRFVKPIHSIQSSMRKVAQGDFNERCNIKSRDEIGQLAQSFDSMTGQLEDSIRQIRLDERRKEELTLQALQAQINPHFLLNTLNAIRMVANMNQDTAVSNMLVALGKLMHLSMDRENVMITVQEEIEAVRSYALIQKLRFAKKFSIAYDIQKEALHVSIPKFTLQPIVENSFTHAFDDAHRFVQIEVRVVLQEDTLLLEVANDGAALSVGAQGVLSGENFSGVGLKNVNQRIQLYFGKEFGVSIRERDKGGTVTSVCIPAGKEDTQ